MANIKFMLRDTESKTEQTIYITSRFGRNEKLMYATPLKIEPKFWDQGTQRTKNSKYCLNKEEINNTLNTIESTVKSFIIKSAKDGDAITKDELKDFFDIHFGKKAEAATNFHSFFQQFIERCDTRVSPRRGGQTIDYKTKREYARTYYYVREYEKKRKVKLEFKSINQYFSMILFYFFKNWG